ncbi:MAG TPA: hypothetical protein VF742_07085, partial [Terracidiphilus sp.]
PNLWKSFADYFADSAMLKIWSQKKAPKAQSGVPGERCLLTGVELPGRPVQIFWGVSPSDSVSL